MGFYVKSCSRISVAFIVALVITPVALATGGRHIAPTDQAPAGQHGPVQAGYGRATIYRADEPPKSAAPATEQPRSEAVRSPRPASVDLQDAPLPIIIQGVPHRFRLHYSQTAC